MPDPFLLGFGSGGAAADAVRSGVTAAGVGLRDIDRLIMASAVPSAPEELSLATAVAGALEIAPRAGAFGVAFGGASGLLAIVQGADAIRTGAARVVVAGGVETPSRVPYWVPGLRGAPAADPGVVVDPLPVARFDPASTSAVDGGDRAAQDAFARRSHDRAGRPGRSIDELAALKPIHSPQGTITVGNSAAWVDGAAVAVVADRPGRSGEVAMTGSSLIGGGDGAAGALAAAIREAAGDTQPQELAAIEVHESSAALCLATAAALGIDPDVFNRLGGEIATGSPGAAAGALMVERTCVQLRAATPGRAVVAAAGPGGQAVALMLERRH